jgi:hypothetical protein
VLDEELGRDPRDLRILSGNLATRFHEVAPSEAGVRGVERASCLLLAQRDEPGTEVAGVDRLHRRVRWCGREHLASPGDPVRPVREPSRRIVGSGDEARPDDDCPVGEHLEDAGLAESLQRAVALVRHLVLGQIAQLGDRPALVDRRAEVRIHRDRGDEAVVPRAPEHLGRCANRARQVAGRVDHAVPRATVERAEIACAITDQVLGLRVQLGICPAAVEERELVTAFECRVRYGAAEEPRPTEQEDSHASSSSPSSRRSTSSSVL